MLKLHHFMSFSSILHDLWGRELAISPASCSACRKGAEKWCRSCKSSAWDKRYKGICLKMHHFMSFSSILHDLWGRKLAICLKILSISSFRQRMKFTMGFKKWFRELKFRSRFRQSRRGGSRRGCIVARDNDLNKHTELSPGSSNVSVFFVAVRVDWSRDLVAWFWLVDWSRGLIGWIPRLLMITWILIAVT